MRCPVQFLFEWQTDYENRIYLDNKKFTSLTLGSARPNPDFFYSPKQHENIVDSVSIKVYSLLYNFSNIFALIVIQIIHQGNSALVMMTSNGGANWQNAAGDLLTIVPSSSSVMFHAISALSATSKIYLFVFV